MLALGLAGAAFAAVAMSQRSDGDMIGEKSESWDDIEDFTNGRSRDRNLYPGKTLTSETARIIRPIGTGVQHPEHVAKTWTNYHRAYEAATRAIAHNNADGGNNMRIGRNDINKRVRKPHLPDRESYSAWEVVPNATFEHENSADVYPDMDYSWYDDQTGDAVAVPGAPHYIHTAQEYVGNPWGPSGQLYNADGFRTKSKKDLQVDKLPDSLKAQNKVRFYGLPQ